jgi:Uroporphyrinogen decarboxylase (URO-D)
VGTTGGDSGHARGGRTGMTGRERARRALALQRADRPPFHLSFAAAGGELPPWAREWPIRAGVDVIEVRPDVSWPRLPLAPAAARAEPDRACEALLEQPWPDPAEPSLYRSLDRLARAHPDRALFYQVPGLFRMLEGSLGFETFLAAVERAPDVAGELMERLVSLAARIAGEACTRAVLAVLLIEELAGPEGPRAGLEQLDRWIFPFDRLLVEGPAHDNVSIIAWCPGATEALWRRFASIGARLAGPLPAEPAALAAFRNCWSERLGIYGALDSGGVIASGTPEQIRGHVKEVFAAAGPEGGLIFSAADLPPQTPMGNLEALIDAIQDCRY